MSKHFTFSLVGLVFVLFVGWIFVAGTPLERMNRGCAPVVWTGKVASSLTQVFSESVAAKVWGVTAKTFQGCRFVAFKTFYADERARLMAEQAKAGNAPASASTTAPAQHANGSRE